LAGHAGNPQEIIRKIGGGAIFISLIYLHFAKMAVEDELEKVRTSKVSSNKRQNPTNCEVLSLGLPGQDSNLRPIDYTLSIITDCVDYIIAMHFVVFRRKALRAVFSSQNYSLAG